MPTSDPLGSEAGSDITDFAAWEAEHPSQPLEEAEQRADRMRIWGDRDSSNDARSSEELEQENVPGFLLGRKEGNGEGRQEIPGSDAESEVVQELEEDEYDAPRSSQPRPESSSEEETEAVVEDSRQAKAPHKTVIEISSDEEEESESEFEEKVEEADIENDEEQLEQDESEAEEEAEDVFEGFDVNPEDKEFFQKLLDIAPPEAVMELTGKSQRPKPRSHPDSTPPKSIMEPTIKASWISPQSLSIVAPDEQKIKRVKLFAEHHSFREQQKWTDDDLQEYEDDVYGFAKAAGFSDLHAELEVGKAIGAWKGERGIPVLLPEDSDAEKLAKEAREKRKAEKKARRKLNRIEKLSSRNSSAIPELKMPSSQMHPKESKPPTPQPYHYLKQAAAAFAPKITSRNDLSLSTADKKSVGLALKANKLKKGEGKLRKKPRLGPKKSEYFSKSDSSSSPVSAGVQDTSVPSLKPRDVEAADVQRDAQEEKRHLKKARKHLTKPVPKELGAGPDPLKQIAQDPKKAVKEVVLANEASTVKEVGTVASTPAEPEPIARKTTARNHERKRKRKRNKNRLPENGSGEKEASDCMMGEDRTSDLPPQKGSYDGAQKTNTEKNLPLHNQNTDGGNGQPAKRERGDRGRGRKRKNKNETLKMANPHEPGLSANPAPGHLLEATETNQAPSKKRRRSKSGTGERNLEIEEMGEIAVVDLLAELVDTNAHRERRLGHSKKRTWDADALDTDGFASGSDFLDTDMSAQDDELILYTRYDGQGDTPRTQNKQEDFEEENNALQSTQSTWKGFESDDEATFEPSEMPKRKVNVVICTPSRTWTSADPGEHANVQRSPLAEEPTADGDDNVSVFSMTNYGSMDWDHTGDELDKMEVSPKITRRGSTTSPDNQTRVFHELAPLTPRNKRGSASSSSASEKKTSSLQRDSKGRFAPKSASGSVESKSRRNSTASGSASPAVVRDAHGRFAPKNGVPAKRRASMGSSGGKKEPRLLVRNEQGKFASKDGSAKRRASTGSSAVEKTPRSLRRDEHGKFAPNSATSIITLAKRRTLVGSSPGAEPPGSLEPDPKGKFALKETPIPPPRPLAKRRASAVSDGGPVNKLDSKIKTAPKETPILPPKRLKLADYSGHPSPEPTMDDSEPTKANRASKSTKAKRPPAKSPHFMPATPPISPELTRKGKEPISNQAEAAGEPISPRKDNMAVPSTPGSGKRRPPGKTISCIPFPPLSAPHFGLIQEKLAHDPFRLLIAVTFLIRTHGKHAIPVFFELMEKYPTPESLVAADLEEIVPIIRHLGLQNQRANTYQTYAKLWLENPPIKGKRYPVRGYPNPESARDVKKGEILADDDERHAWEIGHMTQGPYAIDSWRIFCRDRLRGEADSWNGEGRGEGFQPEWMRVLPQDKELRAYLRWMWLKEGFEWDPFSGEKEVARPELMRAAIEGRIAWDDQGGMRILDRPMSTSPDLLDSSPEKSQVSTPRVRDDEDLDELA